MSRCVGSFRSLQRSVPAGGLLPKLKSSREIITNIIKRKVCCSLFLAIVQYPLREMWGRTYR